MNIIIIIIIKSIICISLCLNWIYFELVNTLLSFSYYKNFAELGKLCGYRSSIGNLYCVHYRRASGLLVWNSADTACKAQLLILF